MIRRLWEHAGMTCAMRRCAFEAPCGYVLVPEWHPLHGAKYEEAESRLDVHGGVTFAGDLEGLGYAVGFDMSHACDVKFIPGTCYVIPMRTDEESAEETNRLAEQPAVLAERDA